MFFVVEINRCEEYTMNLCHENATCTPTGPSVYNCSCLPGYHGDGYACDPIDPCQVEYGGCDSNTSVCQYDGPGKASWKNLKKVFVFIFARFIKTIYWLHK